MLQNFLITVDEQYVQEISLKDDCASALKYFYIKKKIPEVYVIGDRNIYGPETNHNKWTHSDQFG